MKYVGHVTHINGCINRLVVNGNDILVEHNHPKTIEIENTGTTAYIGMGALSGEGVNRIVLKGSFYSVGPLFEDCKGLEQLDISEAILNRPLHFSDFRNVKNLSEIKFQPLTTRFDKNIFRDSKYRENLMLQAREQLIELSTENLSERVIEYVIGGQR